jgi:NADH-quinone oxidoreductase subunit E
MTDEDIIRIVDEHEQNGDGVISILEEIQARNNFLPESALRLVSEKTGVSLVDIYGIATFYRFFSLKPKGKHLMTVCLGTACHVRGGQGIADEFQKHLCICPGDTTEDKEITFETVNCLGACALGPIVVADGHYFSKVKTNKVREVIEATLKGLDKGPEEGDERVFPISVGCPKCNRSLMDMDNPINNYPSVKLTASFANKHGSVYLSGIYGRYDKHSEMGIPKGTNVDYFCPFCHSDLVSGSPCTICGSQMIPLQVHGGGVWQICQKEGCTGHLLDLQ